MNNSRCVKLGVDICLQCACWLLIQGKRGEMQPPVREVRVCCWSLRAEMSYESCFSILAHLTSKLFLVLNILREFRVD